jgi:hypothetical protein
MSAVPVESNPFALLMEPESVLALVERSAALAGLRRRVHRPLDKPQIPHAQDGDGDGFGGSADVDHDPNFGAAG